MKTWLAVIALLMMPTLIAGAQGQPDHVKELHQAIDDRKAAFEEAKTLEDKEAQKEKHRQAREEFWGKMNQLFDEDEPVDTVAPVDSVVAVEDLEIEIEFEAGQAFVEVEMKDESAEFMVLSEDLSAVITEIMERFDLTESQIRAVMEVEYEEEDDSSDQDEDDDNADEEVIEDTSEDSEENTGDSDESENQDNEDSSSDSNNVDNTEEEETQDQEVDKTVEEDTSIDDENDASEELTEEEKIAEAENIIQKAFKAIFSLFK